MDLILLIIISIGITNIIQNETIFSKIRNYIYNKFNSLYNYITCPTCFGFLIGVLISFYFVINENMFLNMFFCGVISSISNKIFSLLLPEKFGSI